MSRDQTDTDQSKNYRSIVVRMPAAYGTFILRKYYENPDFFRNSYEFIHHVCPASTSRTKASRLHGQRTNLHAQRLLPLP